MPNPITVYVVEDNEVTRSVIRDILTIDENLVLAGETGDGDTAVREVSDLKPNVLLVDTGLPGIDGLQVLKLIKAKLPDTKAIMLSGHDSSSSMFDAFAAGAQAYFSKNDFNPEKLVKTIIEVQSGSYALDSATVRQMIKDVAGEEPNKLDGLSEKQKRVLLLVANRADAKEPGSQSDIERAVSDKIESDVPSGDWNSFLKRLEKFKE